MQLVADPRDGLRDKVASFVQDADFDGPPAAALHLPTHSGHQHGTCADGFTVVLFVVEAKIEVPPIVKQGDEIGHEPTGAELARGEPVPSPLVFEFVEAVFGIGAVAVVFGDHLGREGLFIQRGDDSLAESLRSTPKVMDGSL